MVSQQDIEKHLACKPDFQYWAKVSLWRLWEGLLLLSGSEPHKGPLRLLSIESPKLNFNFIKASLPQKLRDWEFRALRSIDAGELQSASSERREFKPQEFLAWAKSKDIEVPAELDAALSVIEQGRTRSQESTNAVTQREQSKAKTQARHAQWQHRAEDLRAENPTRNKTWIATKIAKEGIANGCSPETVRRNIHI